MKRKNTNNMSFLPSVARAGIQRLYGFVSAGCPIRSGMTAVMLLALSFAQPASAYTSCVGGTIITRNEYGSAPEGVECTPDTCPVHGTNETAKTFCLSDQRMGNWWSAFTWCKSNGGTLASFFEMCPRTPTDGTSPCSALQGKSDNIWFGVWSSLGAGTSRAYFVYLASGVVQQLSRHYQENIHALCE